MTRFKKVFTITDLQKEILKDFIIKFLPQRDNKRKNSGNEIEFVHKTLNIIFNKRFKFRLMKDDIVNTFVELNYDMFYKSEDIACQSPSHYPIKYRHSETPKSSYDSEYVHIDISPITVRLLKATTSIQSRTLDNKRIKSIENLTKELDIFQNKYKI